MTQRIPNTFGLDVYAQEVIEVNSTEQLLAAWQHAQLQQLPSMILGCGSNTLFTTDYAGIIILNRIKGIAVVETEHDWLIKVGAGEIWQDVVSYTVQQGMGGLENLALIPGRVGSAPIQNIGAYGVEFERVADHVVLLDLRSGQELIISDGQYGYRDSVFKHRYADNYAVISVGIRLSKQWSPVLTYGELTKFDPKHVTPQIIFDKVCEIRRSKLPDPNIVGNGGSFFKNPIVTAEHAAQLRAQYPTMPAYPQDPTHCKLAAAWLIDQCQLKGFQYGGAAVHDKQALVLVNKHQATPLDIIQLAAKVRAQVAEKFSVLLSPEIRFIGAQGEIDADEMLSDYVVGNMSTQNVQ